MPKINQEEYEILKKKQEKGHKYIAREKEGHVIAFTDYHGKSEYRWLVTINEDDLKYESLFNSSKVFQFIQWEDDEPYNIQELIEEYLYDNRPKLFIDGQEQSFEFIEESEETEVKNLEWAKNEIKGLMTEESQSYPHDKMVEQEIVLGILNQLDEPETLSPEWIDEHKESWKDLSVTGYSVPEKDLQNLLVPKQDKVAVDEELYEIIKEEKTIGSPLNDIFTFYNLGDEKDQELFARAWLAYPNIEIEQEPRYYAKIKGHENIGSNDKYWNYNTDMEELSVGDSEVHPNVISEYVLKATKDEWANLGINDDNADFVKVEELEEC